MKKEKEYILEIVLKFTEYMPATNKEEAIERVKTVFQDEYNIELRDEEIKCIK